MCGIAGLLRLDGGTADGRLAVAMADALHHRGPDGEGSWACGPVALSHRRLSIIDLAGSAQPMLAPDGSVLTYNGELFNYRRLRADLPGPWASHGDTEVLLRLLLDRGTAGLRDVHGQFAFAWWDKRVEELVLARDALGVLPLYWWTDGRVLAFASEIKALLPVIGCLPPIDRDGLADYLARRSVSAPRTLFAGVRKLRPGHELRASPSGRIIERPWQQQAVRPPAGLAASSAVDALDAALNAAVELALVADVPVGSYLSGGVDSSLIAALARRFRPGVPLHTYCATFDDVKVDESRWAERVAVGLRTQHTAVPVTATDFGGRWEDLAALRDAPLSEPADVAVHLLARAAARDVKVVLSGEGSDELFAGYPKYRHATLTGVVGAVPAIVRGPLLHAVERNLPPSARRLGVALRALGEPTIEERILGWFAPFTGRERAALVGGLVRPLRGTSDGRTLQRMLEADRGSWLADNLLERGDRMTMGASLELRPPFLDKDVVDLARALPASLLVRRGTTKWLVKQVAERYLPREIVHRPKSGFKVPLDAWFRGGLRELANDRLGSPTSFVADHLDHQMVRGILDRHSRGVADESIRIWTLLSLEVWAGQVQGRTCEQRGHP